MWLDDVIGWCDWMMWLDDVIWMMWLEQKLDFQKNNYLEDFYSIPNIKHKLKIIKLTPNQFFRTF